MNITTIIRAKAKKIVRILGPGLITGASDDDPSGIITYSRAGASFGFATLWTVIITFPLMASVQEMCARIGIVTQEGLTAAVKNHYPKIILYVIALFSFPAITLNIGADIQCMGSVSHMLVPAVPAIAYSVFFTTLLIFFIIKFNYQKFALVLKWLCASLLLYIIVPFLVKISWDKVFINTIVPTIRFDKDFINILVAILGTTISPYLFFWQATMEAEDVSKKQNIIIIRKKVIREMQKDIDFGMLFSNLVMFFIILTTAAVLFNAGIRHIDTIEQAAKALNPLTGKLTYLLFSVGVFGTGFLAIPVLAGSLSYIMAETFSWAGGLDKKFHQAKGFYITVIVSLIVGLSLDIFHVSPVQALIYTAILYGLTAPVLIFIIMHICNNKKIMGEHTNKKWSNILGTITLLLMTIASIVLIYFQFI